MMVSFRVLPFLVSVYTGRLFDGVRETWYCSRGGEPFAPNAAVIVDFDACLVCEDTLLDVDSDGEEVSSNMSLVGAPVESSAANLCREEVLKYDCWLLFGRKYRGSRQHNCLERRNAMMVDDSQLPRWSTENEVRGRTSCRSRCW